MSIDSDQQVLFLQRLLEEKVTIAGDIAQLAVGAWAIHGVIPVDGHVIVAEFETYDQARVALDRIAAATAVR